MLEIRETAFLVLGSRTGEVILLGLDSHPWSFATIELEIDAPTFGAMRRFCLAGRQAGSGEPHGLLRLLQELHSGLRRSPASLALIAELAGGDDIFPRLASSLNYGNNMIQGQLISIELGIAVLAGVLISEKDIGP